MATRRRNFKERRDYFYEYSDLELVGRFSLDADGINIVAGLITNEISSGSIKTTP